MSASPHHPGTAMDHRAPSEVLAENTPSRWLQRAQQWLASEERLGGKAEDAHIARHGDCACLPDLWLPTGRGYTDLWAIEHCDLCDIRFAYAYENDNSRVRRSEDAEVESVLPPEWAPIQAMAFLGAPRGDWPRPITICGCCWDTYSAPLSRVAQPSTVEEGTLT